MILEHGERLHGKGLGCELVFHELFFDAPMERKELLGSCFGNSQVFDEHVGDGIGRASYEAFDQLFAHIETQALARCQPCARTEQLGVNEGAIKIEKHRFNHRGSLHEGSCSVAANAWLGQRRQRERAATVVWRVSNDCMGEPM